MRVNLDRFWKKCAHFGGLLVLCLCVLPIAGQKREPIPPVKSSFERQDEGPGKMELLPGYVAGLPEKWSCIDTDCGFIWNPQGLTINYDIGELAGPGLPARAEGSYLWYGETQINGQVLRYAVTGQKNPEQLLVSFPKSSANFNGKVHSEGEVRIAMKMLLTFHGTGYRGETQSSIDGLVLSRNGVPVAKMDVVLKSHGKDHSVKTNANGHFHFLRIAPGTYHLEIQSQPESTCKSSPRNWRLRIDAAQLLLRSFQVPCTSNVTMK
jgi:hypothetical protein